MLSLSFSSLINFYNLSKPLVFINYILSLLIFRLFLSRSLFRRIISSNNLYEILNTSLISYPSFPPEFLFPLLPPHMQYNSITSQNVVSSYILSYLPSLNSFHNYEKLFLFNIKIIIFISSGQNPSLVFQFISKKPLSTMVRFVYPSTCSNKTIPLLHHRGNTRHANLCHAPFNSLRSNFPFVPLAK